MTEQITSAALVAHARALSSLAEYTQNKVVTCELVNNPTGTLAVYAFDENQSLSAHGTPADVFVYVIEGRADVTIGGKGHSVRAGEAIVMPAGQPHSLKANDKFKMLLVTINS